MCDEAIISLHGGAVSVVSTDDYPVLAKHKWYLTSDGCYAKALIDGHYVLMHRLILGLARGVGVVDHRDGDGLNNRRDNIRVCTMSENAQNALPKSTKKVPAPRGVSFDSTRGKWEVDLSVNKIRYRLGRYDTLQEAAQVRRAAELRLHGEFACMRSLAQSAAVGGNHQKGTT